MLLATAVLTWPDTRLAALLWYTVKRPSALFRGANTPPAESDVGSCGLVGETRLSSGAGTVRSSSTSSASRHRAGSCCRRREREGQDRLTAAVQVRHGENHAMAYRSPQQGCVRNGRGGLVLVPPEAAPSER